MATPQEVYFLQELILLRGRAISPNQVKKRLSAIVEQEKATFEVLVPKLQQEADRLGHHINVADEIQSLARAQA